MSTKREYLIHLPVTQSNSSAFLLKNFELEKQAINIMVAIKRGCLQEPELLRSFPLKRQRRSSSTIFTVVKRPLNGEGISECFYKFPTSVYVSLAPVYSLDPVAGVKAQHLDPLLMTYFPAARGIVLAYYNLRLSGRQNKEESVISKPPMASKVCSDRPITFLWISVDFVIWRPKPDDLIEGWVCLQSPFYINLLIHDTFRATIKRDDIPPDWSFISSEVKEPEDNKTLTSFMDHTINQIEVKDTDNTRKSQTIFRNPHSLGYWVDGKGNKIVGKLRFLVKSFDVSGRTASVQGIIPKFRCAKNNSQDRTNPLSTLKETDSSPVKENDKRRYGDFTIIHDVDSAMFSNLNCLDNCFDGESKDID